jgi:hypothetical protein
MKLTLHHSFRVLTSVLSFTSAGIAQRDPGVRGGPPGAGGPLPALTRNELALFTIVGRSDIGFPGCTAAELPPIDFESEYRKGNLS